MLPKIVKEKKYQCNEERPNCIKYLSGGVGVRLHKVFPFCLMHIQVLKSAHNKSRTSWSRERLATPFGGKTQEELELRF